jgi:hypothetical protein
MLRGLQFILQIIRIIFAFVQDETSSELFTNDTRPDICKSNAAGNYFYSSSWIFIRMNRISRVIEIQWYLGIRP